MGRESLSSTSCYNFSEFLKTSFIYTIQKIIKGLNKSGEKETVLYVYNYRLVSVKFFKRNFTILLYVEIMYKISVKETLVSSILCSPRSTEV